MANGESTEGHWVGVDLGGTRMQAGLFDRDARCLSTVKRGIKAERGAEVVVERIRRCVEDAVDEADASMASVRAVGVGIPGRVDPGGRRADAPSLGAGARRIAGRGCEQLFTQPP